MKACVAVVLALGVGVACGGQPHASSPGTGESLPEEQGAPPEEQGAPPEEASTPKPPPPSTATCAPGHTVLATSPEQPPILNRSPSGKFLVFERHLLEVASRRTLALGTQGHLIAFTPDEQRAFFISEESYTNGPQRLFEVRLADGAVRTLTQGGFSILRASPDASAIIGMRYDQQLVVVYTDTGEVRHLGPSSASWLDTANRIHYVFRSGSGLVLVDTERREETRVESGRSLTFLPGGRAVLITDEQNQLWGWQPGASPLLLGRRPADSSPYQYLIPEHEQKRSWGALIVDDKGEVRLWNAETGDLQTLSTDALFARLSPSERKAYVLERGSTEHNVLRIFDLDSGRTQRVQTPASFVGGTFSASGRYVLFSNEGMRRLWDLKRGEEVVLSRQPRTDPLSYGCGQPRFARDESVLHLACFDTEEVLFSTATGQELFASDKSIVPGEGAHSFWGQDGVFYIRQRAYVGPPDGALWAWNPDTKTETFLGERTRSLCFLGDVHVYGRDQLDDDRPFTLSGWNPKSGQGWTIAEGVKGSECIDQGPEVLFTQDALRGEDWRTIHYTLGWANVATRTAQRLALEVESHSVTDETIYYTTARALCAVSRPDTSHGPKE